jgi:hypothetical protein
LKDNKTEINYLDAIHHKCEVCKSFGKEIEHPEKTWMESLETIVIEKGLDINQDRILEFDEEFITLKDIEKKASKNALILVIAESPLGGVVYRYGNYRPEKWQVVGVLYGYA